MTGRRLDVCVRRQSCAVSLWLIYHCVSNYDQRPSVSHWRRPTPKTALPMQIKACKCLLLTLSDTLFPILRFGDSQPEHPLLNTDFRYCTANKSGDSSHSPLHDGLLSTAVELTVHCFLLFQLPPWMKGVCRSRPNNEQSIQTGKNRPHLLNFTKSLNALFCRDTAQQKSNPTLAELLPLRYPSTHI